MWPDSGRTVRDPDDRRTNARAKRTPVGDFQHPAATGTAAACSCHPAHRAIGQVIIDAAAAYTGSSLPDRQNVFLLTTKQTETVPPAAESVTLEAADLTDPTSVVYSSDDVLPGRGITGVSLMKSIISVYPSQISPTATRNGYAFPNDYSSWLDRGFPRTTAFQRVNDYNPSAGNTPRGVPERCSPVINRTRGRWWKRHDLSP